MIHPTGFNAASARDGEDFVAGAPPSAPLATPSDAEAPDAPASDVQASLAAVHARIDRACREAGRDPATVQLLAVSKTFPAQSIMAAVQRGQLAFGENYLQEALDKIRTLSEVRPSGTGQPPDIEWHFIGPIQSNKTRPIAESFDWVHTVERLKIADRLSAQRAADRKPLNVCIQVNVSGEASKSGCAPAEARDLVLAISALPRLSVRGLMAIPEPTDDVVLTRQRFGALRELAAAIRLDLPPDLARRFDTLSMGMSSDLEPAIAEGATIVRIGTALFGQRPPVRAALDGR